MSRPPYPTPRRDLTVQQLVNRFLDNRELEGGIDRRRHYDKHLRRLGNQFGTLRARTFRGLHLLALRDGMIRDGFAPKTINHDVVSVKTLFRWAYELEIIPHLNLGGVRTLPLGPIQWSPFSRLEARVFVLERAGKPDLDFLLTAYLAIQYLTAMRPKEIVRFMTGQGEWVQPGVYRMANKMGWRTRMPRYVLFSPEALSWAEAVRGARPRWTRIYTYSRAVVRSRGEGPHRLRHSAATHLHEAGVSRRDVDLILGHYPSTISLIYNRPFWRRLRHMAARLSLLR